MLQVEATGIKIEEKNPWACGKFGSLKGLCLHRRTQHGKTWT
jgi:hypothetical protein